MYICFVFHYIIFFFNDTATTEIYTYLHTLSLHDALPISARSSTPTRPRRSCTRPHARWNMIPSDSMRPKRACSNCARWRANMASSPTRSEEHTSELQSLMRISYAVFCLKKKNKQNKSPNKTNYERSIKRQNTEYQQ